MKAILLVEDNSDNELLTVRAFKKNKIANELVVAHDGQEALDALFSEAGAFSPASGQLPELILLDLKLPKIEGLDVLRRIRAEDRTRHLPVVILTSSDEQRDIVESYDLGANSYVRKPVDFTEFSEAIRVMGLYWLVLNKSIVPVLTST